MRSSSRGGGTSLRPARNTSQARSTESPDSAARHRHARHRHIDWIGACSKLKIVSAPSSVMGGTNEAPTNFLIHTLTTGPGGQVGMLAPERVDIAGVNAAD